MLVGDGWAFIHIPKCGGTSIRAARQGREVSEIWPIDDPTFSHRFHMIARERPPGIVFTTVRRPDSWLASFWKMRQKRKNWSPKMPLDRLFEPDLDRYCERVVTEAPGYIDSMFRGYLSVYEAIEAFRLEDGLARFGCRTRKNAIDGPKPARELARAIMDASPWTMERFYS